MSRLTDDEIQAIMDATDIPLLPNDTATMDDVEHAWDMEVCRAVESEARKRALMEVAEEFDRQYRAHRDARIQNDAVRMWTSKYRYFAAQVRRMAENPSTGS